MKNTVVLATAVFVIAALLLGKPKDLNWQPGVLISTRPRSCHCGRTTAARMQPLLRAENSNPALDAAGDAAMASAAAAGRAAYRTKQTFVIQGGNLMYTVARWTGRHNPNVTVNGQIHYAMDQGKFYLLDEDGKSFGFVVIEKVLAKPSDPKE